MNIDITNIEKNTALHINQLASISTKLKEHETYINKKIVECTDSLRLFHKTSKVILENQLIPFIKN